MRHGEAGFSASSDANRTLTPRGNEQAIIAGQFLYEQHFAFDLALVSPYVRAQQTLNGLATKVQIAKRQTLADLVPGGNPNQVIATLSEQLTGLDNIIIVSHLPLVGYLVNELCPQLPPPMFSTAAIACVRLPSEDTLLAGSGTLEWMHQEM